MGRLTNNRSSFLTVLRASILAVWQGPASSLKDGHLLSVWCLHVAEGARALFGVSHESMNPIVGALLLFPSHPKGSPPHTITWEVRISTDERGVQGGHTNVQSIAKQYQMLKEY